MTKSSTGGMGPAQSATADWAIHRPTAGYCPPSMADSASCRPGIRWPDGPANRSRSFTSFIATLSARHRMARWTGQSKPIIYVNHCQERWLSAGHRRHRWASQWKMIIYVIHCRQLAVGRASDGQMGQRIKADRLRYSLPTSPANFIFLHSHLAHYSVVPFPYALCLLLLYTCF